MILIRDVLNVFEETAPLALQESYDNSGLIVGDPGASVSKVLLCVDVNEAVVEEAQNKGCELIVSHHPIIFKGLKKLVPSTYVERTVMAALRNNIAIMAMHTNLDNSFVGVNHILANKLGLNNLRILEAKQEILSKVVVFVPHSHQQVVREAMFEAGGGHIGAYDNCSFNVAGKGTFRAGEGTNPFLGEKGVLHEEDEIRVELVVPTYNVQRVVKAMLASHPYEEVAYDVIPLANAWDGAGAGMIGNLESPVDERDFLKMVAETCGIPVLRHSPLIGKKISRVAVCGGSGSFLLGAAKRAGVDAFVTADVKYHDFHDAAQQLLMVDAGHYETEQFTKELMAGILTKKFPNFAVLFSEVNTNAVGYYLK